ncbi:MAG: peptide ABC transporter substrate-binding protein [Deltaproteobacteria bacterium]|nr:peptide ABC transporter substrate-binding protein [Deltaproteobacteria bacterium]
MEHCYRMLGVGLMAVMITGACSRTTTNAQDGTAGAGNGTRQVETARYLNFNNWNEPEYLDPGLSSGIYESNIIRNLFEGLVGHDPRDASPQAAGAERWDISADGRHYTFHLRTTARWTDGRPVTAHDYVYAWERVLNPKTGSKYAFALHYIKHARDYNTGRLTDASRLGFRAVDDFTLEVTLETPTPFMLAFMCYPTFFPVPRWAIEAHGARWTQPEHLVSNGAFALRRWVPYKEILLVKNDRYWDAARVTLPGVRFLPIEDKETALKMYAAGQLDIDWELPEAKIPSLLTHPDYVGAPYFSTYFYNLNTTKPPLDDVRVRRALTMAIDRETLINAYLQRTQAPATGFVPSVGNGYHPAAAFAFDPAQAKRLMAEAGYPGGANFPVLELHYNTSEHHKQVAQIVQQMWKEHLGISVVLHNEEWKTYLKTQQLMQHQISRAGWVGDYLDPNTFLEMFRRASTIDHTGWKNAEYDGLLDQAMLERDTRKRMAFLQQAEALLLREAPIIPIYVHVKHMLIRPSVRGVSPNPMDVHPMKAVTMAEGE